MKLEEISIKYKEFTLKDRENVQKKIIKYICDNYSSRNELLDICDYILSSSIQEKYSISTLLVKKFQLYDLEYMNYFKKWIDLYINSWGSCDIFCYRIVNPMIEKYPNLFVENLNWAKSKNPYIRRLAVVSLIHSSQAFSVRLPFSYISDIIDILKYDQNIYVKKGIGWLLKYSYLKYNEETVKYIINNISILSSITINYSMQKMSVLDRGTIKEAKCLKRN